MGWPCRAKAGSCSGRLARTAFPILILIVRSTRANGSALTFLKPDELFSGQRRIGVRRRRLDLFDGGADLLCTYGRATQLLYCENVTSTYSVPAVAQGCNDRHGRSQHRCGDSVA